MTAPLAAHVGEAVQILCDPGLSSQLGTLQGQGLARIWDFCSRGGNWTFLSLPAEHKLLFRPPGPPQVLGYVVPPHVDLGVDPRKIQKRTPGTSRTGQGAGSLYALCLFSDACCVPQWSALCPVSQENVQCRVRPLPTMFMVLSPQNNPARAPN